jgi:hypothetical protein
MDVSGHLHASAALTPGENPPYPLDMRLGGNLNITSISEPIVMKLCMKTMPNEALSTAYLKNITATQILHMEAITLILSKHSFYWHNTCYSPLINLYLYVVTI